MRWDAPQPNLLVIRSDPRQEWVDWVLVSYEGIINPAAFVLLRLLFAPG